LPFDTAEEKNFKRIRGMLPRSLSNKFGSIVLTTAINLNGGCRAMICSGVDSHY
jgi:hypothetical protein